MKYLPLIWANLKHNKLRTSFTFCSIFFAFVLFGALTAVKNAFGAGAEAAQTDRLRMIHKVSVVQALPLHYYDQILDTAGVRQAGYVSWFSGEYQDPGNFFVQLAVSDAYLDLHPEYRVDATARARWETTRTGAIAGRALAERFGWQIGERVPLTRAIYQQADGSTDWQFTVEAIFDGIDDSVDESQLFFHHVYLEESSPWAHGEVRWFEIETTPGSEPADVAARLDNRFATSGTPTKTSTERAFLRSFANQVGDTALIITSVVGVTLFVVLLVVANAIAHSVRERLPELAVLKAVGFSDSRVMGIVISECALLCAVAGGLGLLAASQAVQLGLPTLGMTSAFRIATSDFILGAALLAVLAGIGASAAATMAFRLRVVSALGGR